MTPQERPKTRHRIRWARVLMIGLLAVGGVAAATGQADSALARQSHLPTATLGRGNFSLARELHTDLEAYLRAQGQAEHVSATALSVSLPGHRSTIEVSAGNMWFGGSRPVPPDSTWQIGSNTKAFTSVLLLRLEAEHRLSIDDTLGRWLPQYPQWSHVTIKRLLNMTSGIPSYDNQPAFLADYASDPDQYFTKNRLVAYVTGAPATSGYSYSNTNYVLAEMIIEKASRDSYQHQLYTRIIEPLGLHDLYYRPDFYPPLVTAREPAGYYFSGQVPELTGLAGRDVSRHTLSWARGAGGIVGTTHDMTVWERALYGGALLPPKQQAELTSLVSTKTGQPIERTSMDDPDGFGLGVDQATNRRLGTYWFYEGGTFGFRVVHVYLPGSGVIMAMGLNSFATQDHIGTLTLSVYDTLVSHGLIRPAAAPVGAGRQ